MRLNTNALFPDSLLLSVPMLADNVNSVGRSFVLHTCGEVTAALKRAFTLQPSVEDRSVQVVIDGDSNWRATRLLEADYNR